jgi:hypothetical protein
MEVDVTNLEITREIGGKLEMLLIFFHGHNKKKLLQQFYLLKPQ